MKIPFPAEVLKQHTIVLGKTGSGKSSKLRVAVENLLRLNKRVCVVDIKGDWWGLKSSADGKGPGFPVIAFGNFREPKATDVPINAQSGQHVAELIATGNRPCIIGFRGWMPADIVEFWIGNESNRWSGFASTLFNKNEGELYVVISECHNFAPKGRVQDPRAGRLLHWTNRLLTEGRGLGMSFLLDSQRPQKVHNDTLTSCETLIACRITYPADRDAIKDWINGCGDTAQGKQVLESLASIDRSQAWMWSPEIGFGPKLVEFPMFETFDSFAPAQLQHKISDKGWSSVDLEAVKEKLATVIEEAKGNDPSALKARIRELQESRMQSAPKDVYIADPKAILEAVLERDAQWLDIIRTGQRRIHQDLLNRAQTIPDVNLDIDSPAPFSPAPAKLGGIPLRIDPTMPRNHIDLADRNCRRPAAVNIGTGKGGEDLSGPQRQILQRLAEFAACGRSSVRLPWLAASMGTTVRARGFEENMRTLTKAGFIAKHSGDYIKATPEGEAVAGPQLPLNGEELRNRIAQMCSGPQAEILRFLLAQNRPVTPDLLATHFNTTVRARGFEENIRFLRSNDLITTPGGQVQVADWLL